jgi:hypothetical protein
MTSLCTPDIVLGTGAHVCCMGKGRKERCTPLAKQAVDTLKRWLREPRRGSDILFPSARGTRLSADGVQFLLAKHVAAARQKCPSLKNKRVTPRVLRHSAAMELLQAGVGRSVIALWLGHESIETTQIYLDADLALKEKALAKTTPMAKGKTSGRYRPDDKPHGLSSSKRKYPIQPFKSAQHSMASAAKRSFSGDGTSGEHLGVVEGHIDIQMSEVAAVESLRNAQGFAVRVAHEIQCGGR